MRSVRKVPAITVGAMPAAIKEARITIMAILGSPAADEVKARALDTLNSLCSVHGLTITNNTFQQ